MGPTDKELILRHIISNNGSSFDHLARVSDIIANGQWSIPSTIADNFRLANINISTIPPPLLGEDIRVWKPSLTGYYSVANGMKIHREKFSKIHWSKLIWRKCIHLSRSANIWKILSGCCTTDKRLQDRGINITSRCFLCLKNIEDDTHLFWICPFAATIWSWIHELFGFQWNLHVQNFETVTAHATTRSAAIRDLWAAAITNVLTEIWHHRNSCIFNNILASSRRVKSKILANFFECSILMKITMHNRVEDLMIFKNLQINLRPAKPTRVLQCFWSLPDLDQLRIGCDGCSKGNPDPSGAGVILRDHTGNTIGTMSAELGICTNFVAELLAIILGLEWASDRGWSKIWVTFDSQTAIKCFASDKVPWFINSRWHNIRKNLTIKFSSVFREINFAADTMSKRGANLPLGTKETFDHRPSFLAVENPNTCYFRFS
ncbi:Ribonuclease H domain [Macleaya cordata]|uniref:Ribonuclease H domain n=1 Tax=Macleaya cordata TaxID=56857 RepID=A0A200Q7D1_MACCD|nr:Ribonuclease H domain [Macleaya cordata]